MARPRRSAGGQDVDAPLNSAEWPKMVAHGASLADTGKLALKMARREISPNSGGQG